MLEVIVLGGGMAGAMAVHRRLAGEPRLVWLALASGLIGGMSLGQIAADQALAAFTSGASPSDFSSVPEKALLATCCLIGGGAAYAFSRWMFETFKAKGGRRALSSVSDRRYRVS